MDQEKLELLYDRMEIIDTINRYATSVDTCDWDLFLTCYTEEINVDMVSVGFEKPMTMPAKEFLEIIRRAVSPFESTQRSRRLQWVLDAQGWPGQLLWPQSKR